MNRSLCNPRRVLGAHLLFGLGFGLSRWLARLTLAALVLGCAAVLAAWLIPLPARLHRPSSVVVTYADGRVAHVFLTPDHKWRLAVDLRRVDPAYIKALVALEDQRFDAHHGVDPWALARAALGNLKTGRITSGGSTITMQLARLLEPRPRTLDAKVVEAFRAFQLELRLSKADILEQYLQRVPYGRNIEGIEAASLAYFGHRARSLTADEIATLLAVPQRPHRRFPHPHNAASLGVALGSGSPAAYYNAAPCPRGKDEARLSGQALLARMRRQPVPVSLKPLPRQVPHAAYGFAAHPTHGQLPGPIHTTLDAGIQRLAERLLRRHQRGARAQSIHNAAVVVVDHQQAVVKALVGGFDWSATDHGSKLPAYALPRSTGSLLKPLIYAMAIDSGLTLPRALVVNTPLRMGTFRPQNYDGKHAGLVRLEEALSQSLNVPFVHLLASVGSERLVGLLRTLGFAHLQERPGYYGLAAAIGGVEATALEVAALYTMLAHQGRYRPLRWRQEARPSAATGHRVLSPGHRVLSPGAVWLTGRALSRRDRPGFPGRRLLLASPASGGIRWKTGTSNGHRDAWAVGSGSRFTVVVWLGNLDNTASPALVGALRAGPILFDLLEALGEQHVPAPPRPDELIRVRTCAYSGYLAGPACEQTVSAWANAASLPTTVCPFHVRLLIDRKTGEAVTPPCRGARQVTPRTFVIWPSSVRRWATRQHRVSPRPPRFARGCTPVAQLSAPPRIISPPQGQELILPGTGQRSTAPGTGPAIPLEAESQAGRPLSWFVDGVFLGSAISAQRLWWHPTPGPHEVLVMDENGKSQRRRVNVTVLRP